MCKKQLAKMLLVLLATATLGANAAIYELSGEITVATGAFVALTPVGSPIVGPLEINFIAGVAGPTDILSVNFNVGDFCFSGDVIPGCPLGGAFVPLVSTDAASLTLAGTMVGGTMSAVVFVPTFMLAIPILFDFDAGTFFIGGGALGTVEGMVALAAPVPVPAAVWLMGSALLGLFGARRRG